MTTDETVLRTVLMAFAVFLTIPLFMMGVVMPVVVLSGWGPISAVSVGWWMVLPPLIPLTLLGTILYVLYSRFDGGHRRGTGPNAE